MYKETYTNLVLYYLQEFRVFFLDFLQYTLVSAMYYLDTLTIIWHLILVFFEIA